VVVVAAAHICRSAWGTSVNSLSAPAWLVEAASAVVETGEERAVHYESADEYIVVVTGREFVFSGAHGPPGRADPRGDTLVLRFSKDGSRQGVGIPYVPLDVSSYAPPQELPLRRE
jgi:hypothetical protein